MVKLRKARIEVRCILEGIPVTECFTYISKAEEYMEMLKSKGIDYTVMIKDLGELEE